MSRTETTATGQPRKGPQGRKLAADGGITKCTPEAIAVFAEGILLGQHPKTCAEAIGIRVETARLWRLRGVPSGPPAYRAFREAWDAAALRVRRDLLRAARSVALPHDEITEKTETAITDDGAETERVVERTIKRGVVSVPALKLLLEWTEPPSSDPDRRVPKDRVAALRERLQDLRADRDATTNGPARATMAKQIAGVVDELIEITKAPERTLADLPPDELEAYYEQKGEELAPRYQDALLRGVARAKGKDWTPLEDLPDAEPEDPDEENP